MANRLAGATSPYLLQHALNPVDWWEWGPEAFAEAKRRDTPILLSVGYAACHWCHVMAHESFEDPATAAVMNEHFVCIKVDREERPDVDAVYMNALQAMSGHGGWPLTAFCTPDGAPFHTGTYFPPQPRHGMPSFPQLCLAIAQAWQEQREHAEDVGRRVREALDRRLPAASEGAVTAERLTEVVGGVLARVDRTHGGFGDAPKFPPSTTLEHLLRHAARTGRSDVLGVVSHTCEAMARGGMYDQLAGGFARYSVDRAWVVPHFEKMLYDNALLLTAYLHWWRLTGEPLGERVARETADFLLRELRTPEGGFAASLDADSVEGEGAFAVWTPAQLDEVLGPDDGRWAARLLGVTPEGTFEHGASVLQRHAEPDEEPRWQRVRAGLLAHRLTRPQPGRDDKVVSSWNGLAIRALAEAGVLLAEPRYLAAAEDAATLLLRLHLDGGRLRRASRDGVGGAPAGVLADHADVGAALLTLYQVTGSARWLAPAERLLDVVLDHFDDGDGGFFDTADDAEVLMHRPQDPTDTPAPSGWASAADALLTYAALTGSARHRQAAEAALGVPLGLAGTHPSAVGWALAVAEAVLDGPREVAVVGVPDDDRTALLHRAALASAAPGCVVAMGAPGAEPAVPLLDGRRLLDGAPAAYVCRSFTCSLPTTSVTALEEQLRS